MEGVRVFLEGAESARGGSTLEVSGEEASAGEGLKTLFRLARRAIVRVADDRGDGYDLMKGRFCIGKPWEDLCALRRDCEVAHPIELEPGFESVPSIAAGVWRGVEVFSEPSDDAILQLRWSAGTLDLPMHVHAYSDRFIVVLEGEGFFHMTAEPFDEFTARAIESIPVKAQDVLIFGRRLLHTFSAPTKDLVLLSYHAPLIELDDTRQYTIPRIVWRPRALHGVVEHKVGA